MEALKKKWNSRRGATMILALLFMLVCMMVGSSLLMASASNMGKIRSNKEEHQKYFTVSSAVARLCDELTGVEYVGKYSYQWEECEHVLYQYDDDENDIHIKILEHPAGHRTYTQKYGEVRIPADPENPAASAKEWSLNKDVLPLYKNLDNIFAGNFRVPAEIPGCLYNYTSNSHGSTPSSYKLKFTVKEGDDDTDDGHFNTVTITAEMNATTGRIVLIAALENDSDKEYVMEAALQPKDDLKKVLILENDPGGDGDYGTDSVTWTVEYIKKGASEDAEPEAT